MFILSMFLCLTIKFTVFCPSSASVGDRSSFYQQCVGNCHRNNCTSSGADFLPKAGKLQPPVNKLLLWSCYDECKYDCTWKTVDQFKLQNWKTPQFHGKWPFIRVLGVQELGSVIGSILNLLANLYVIIQLFKRFQFEDTPLLWIWYMFFTVSINAWVWSIIFHTRDYYFTEFMDYACAFAMVLTVFFCFGVRVLYEKRSIYQVLFGIVCLSYFINHVTYLYTGKIDYAYNMLANIVAGAAGGSGWLLWSLLQWRRGHSYVWPCGLFVFLSMLLLSLELLDFPPVFGLWDAHALWHMTTTPLPLIFFRFIDMDLKRLRKSYLVKKEKMKLE